MLLGTHNSFTYLSPSHWWLYPINFTAKCQSASIEEQYFDYGVRAFDFRVRFTKHGEVVLAHGLVTYKEGYDEFIHALTFLNLKGGCYVKISLETRNCFTRSEYQDECFKILCENLERHYVNIKFYGGCETGKSEHKYTFRTVPPTSDGFHASWETKNKLDDLWPWLYAKQHNSESYKKGSEKDIMFLDFVNVGFPD